MFDPFVVAPSRSRSMTLQQWVDEIGYESTVSAGPRRIKYSSTAKVARQGDGSGPMIGETIVFTVEISRAEAALAGCDVADSVTKKTTILVVGDQGMRLTRGQRRARSIAKLKP